MADPIQTAARAIAKAKTTDHFRIAIGATLNEISAGYVLAKELPSASAYGPKQAKAELDRDRFELEAHYKKVAAPGTIPVNEGLAEQMRASLRRAWVTVAGVRGGADSAKGWRGADILLDAIKDAPAVLRKAVQETIKETGSIAGGLVGSVLVGFWPILLAAAAVALVYLAARRKGLI